MLTRTFSEQWEAVRLRFNGFRSRPWTPERAHSLLFLLWPLVGFVIAILVIRRASTAKELADTDLGLGVFGVVSGAFCDNDLVRA